MLLLIKDYKGSRRNFASIKILFLWKIVMPRGKMRRKVRQKSKRIMKVKSGKNVPFDLQNSPKKYAGFCNRFCYKTNIHRLIYKDASFSNIKFQASNMSNCNYRNAKLENIDFVGCNLKKSNFSGASLRNVLFLCCKLTGVVFTNCKFRNVYFVMTNTDKCVGLPNEGFIHMRSYPKIDVDEKIKIAVERMISKREVDRFHVLHVTKSKLNMWAIKILMDRYGDMTGDLLLRLSMEKKQRNLYSLGSYCDFIESHYIM